MFYAVWKWCINTSIVVMLENILQLCGGAYKMPLRRLLSKKRIWDWAAIIYFILYFTRRLTRDRVGTQATRTARFTIPNNLLLEKANGVNSCSEGREHVSKSFLQIVTFIINWSFRPGIYHFWKGLSFSHPFLLISAPTKTRRQTTVHFKHLIVVEKNDISILRRECCLIWLPFITHLHTLLSHLCVAWLPCRRKQGTWQRKVYASISQVWILCLTAWAFSFIIYLWL